jgi:hypothetical protein
MDDLTPEQLSGNRTREKFHSEFREHFGASDKFSEYDDQDEWGDQWRGVSSVRELEG